MVVFERGKSITILYAVRGFRTGETVTCTVYKSDGTEAKASHSMVEVGTTGVYTSSFVPQNIATYFSICDCAAYPLKAYKEYHAVKAFIKGGAIMKPQPVITTKDKIKIMDILERMPIQIEKISQEIENNKRKTTLNHEQKLQQENNNIEKIETGQNLIKSNIDMLFNKIKTNIDNNFQQNILSLNQANLKTVETYFNNLSKKLFSYFQTEIEKISQKTILSRFDDLKTVSTALSQTLDETSANIKLSNELIDTNLKTRIVNLTENTDELILLLKNAEKNKQ